MSKVKSLVGVKRVREWESEKGEGEAALAEIESTKPPMQLHFKISTRKPIIEIPDFPESDACNETETDDKDCMKDESDNTAVSSELSGRGSEDGYGFAPSSLDHDGVY